MRVMCRPTRWRARVRKQRGPPRRGEDLEGGSLRRCRFEWVDGVNYKCRRSSSQGGVAAAALQMAYTPSPKELYADCVYYRREPRDWPCNCHRPGTRGARYCRACDTGRPAEYGEG